jgi:ankyrin repeat protein
MGQFTMIFLVFFFFLASDSALAFSTISRLVKFGRAEEVLLTAIKQQDSLTALQIIKDRTWEYQGPCALHDYALEALDFTDPDTGDSPLSLSVRYKNSPVLATLLDSGVDPNGASNSNGDLPLALAFIHNYSEAAHKLIQHPKIDLQRQNSKGQTVLHALVLSEKWQAIPDLLSKGADPAIRDNQGNSPLAYMIDRYSTQIISSTDSANFSADFKEAWLAFFEHSSLTEIDSDGNSIVHLAVRNGNVALLKQIQASYEFRRESDLRLSSFKEFAQTATNHQVQTALSLAVLKEKLDLVVFLLNQIGVSPNDQIDSQGNTPLLRALYGSSRNKINFEIVFHFLIKGADVRVKNFKDECALDLIRNNSRWLALFDLTEEIKTVPLQSNEIRELMIKVNNLPKSEFTLSLKRIIIGHLKSKLRSALAREFEASTHRRELHSCFYCKEKYEVENVSGPAKCKCFICPSCAQDFTKYALREARNKSIECQGCHKPVYLEYLEANGMSQIEADHYCELMRDRVDLSRVPCPTADCPGGMSRDELKQNSFFSCEFCDFSGCVQCKKVHTGECSISSVDLDDESPGDKDTLNFIKNQTQQGAIKKCPKCSVSVEKNEGCNHMTCASCGHEWNW